jgi:DNA-directed RNA polymerase beta' subunit
MYIFVSYSGLYDLKMGPTDSSANCVTCGLSYFNCPGHAGHLELDVPVRFFRDQFVTSSHMAFFSRFTGRFCSATCSNCSAPNAHTVTDYG